MREVVVLIINGLQIISTGHVLLDKNISSISPVLSEVVLVVTSMRLSYSACRGTVDACIGFITNNGEDRVITHGGSPHLPLKRTQLYVGSSGKV